MKRKKFKFKNLKNILPYIIAGVLTLALVFIGSIDKYNSSSSLSLSAFAATDYKVSVDQISELYMVADLSNALSLASADDTASNYVITNTMYKTGQTSAEKIDKVHIVDAESSDSVIIYTVKAGEDMNTIAARFGLTTDQIRWSNNLKTTDISEGDSLYLSTIPGIVYTVKSDDSFESIADRYGSSAEEIIALNGLQNGLSEGTKIAIKGGSLPEKERPEYVAPVYHNNYSYAYTYLGSTSERIGIEVIGYNYYGGGQCVGYAMWYRNVSGLSPLGTVGTNWGNANTWAINAANSGYLVDNSPEVGAVFQTSSGWAGHVGVVTGINSDGSIVVQEANYNYIPGRITRATIPASAVGNFYYIH